MAVAAGVTDTATPAGGRSRPRRRTTRTYHWASDWAEYQRRADGEIAAAIVIERNHLEWRLHPKSEGRIPEARDLDVKWVVACNEGYASSFAAATLRLIGFRRATDIIGGFQAWRTAGLPVVSDGAPSDPRFDREG